MGGPVSKKLFSALRASQWCKNKGQAQAPEAPPLDPPLVLFYGLTVNLKQFSYLTVSVYSRTYGI